MRTTSNIFGVKRIKVHHIHPLYQHPTTEMLGWARVLEFVGEHEERVEITIFSNRPENLNFPVETFVQGSGAEMLAEEVSHVQ